ncbi:hypothetical protein PCC7424_3514 [Gloeothece citriformis PCC 7424]|uniref:Uncharacterized protein n=1 Tax=Gloeothece citriformis (strain PCC 7424) TaxID=65393 RepID=B7KGH9_GLOC7|nr:hypothetical protein [Gloeothece citriformis]ACK71906.1 hypothetical protein PCC7424_3514 [Gloeothece citriformis PCC 7424]
MKINDLEHLEIVNNSETCQKGAVSFPGFSFGSLLGSALSNFTFDSLASGQHGAFAAGESNVLTTAYANNYNVGFTFTYASQAIGLPVL